MAKRNKKRVVRRKRGRRKGKRSTAKRTHGENKFHKALCVLKSMKHSDRCKALSCANSNFIRKFSTTLRKLKYRNISAKQRKRLKPYKKELRTIASPKVSAIRKRKILSQRGAGFLSALLPLAASVVAPLVNKIFGRK